MKMKIIALSASNVKRLKAVEIKPDGSVVIVGGKNGAGKSSVLDSIAYALGGTKLCPGEPIRRGEKSASVTVDLGEYVVERSFTAKGSRLTVKNADGFKAQSPQTLLDGIVGPLSFDPLAFAQMHANDQAETLRVLVGLDFSELDHQRKAAYDQRTDLNRDVKQLEAQIDGLPEVDAPAEPVSVTDLMAELEAAQKHNSEGIILRNTLANTSVLVRTAEEELERIIAEIKCLEKKRASWHEVRTERIDERNKLREQEDKFESADEQPIRDKIAAAEGENEACRQMQARKGLMESRDDAVEAADEQSEAIIKVDVQKLRDLEAADFPVDGLSLGDDGVLFNGLPFDQASSAERLRVSVAMGLSMNPKLKVVLIRDGSLLDDDNLRLIGEMADAADAQVWIERVGEGDECAVIIEDGAVKGESDA